MPETFILIPGRTAKQGTTLNEGKFTQGYIDETSTLQMCTDDMERLAIAEGDQVRLSTERGAIELSVKAAKRDELSPGMLFLSYGPLSSQLMGGDTHGTGMPDSKCIDVQLEKLN